MKKHGAALAASLMIGWVLCVGSVDAVAKTVAKKPLIQIAILLDTSNSMDGLISQAKSQLWKIVNELAQAKRNGQIPRLEVALYEYGNDSLPAAEGHLRKVSGLTTDLDDISAKLFALRTNGGSEHCGEVIDRAVSQLTWSTHPKTLKLVYIAGNEPFTQGPMDYRKAAKKAISEGIAVNTVFCGPRHQGIQGKWEDGARLADGSFAHIDQNRRVAHVRSPHDDEIARLGAALNDTYVAYGRRGARKAETQKAQDVNAASAAQGAVVQRAKAKASAVYKNAEWDLVDAMEEGTVELEALEAPALPEPMKTMSTKDQKRYIAKKSEERKALQVKIQKLSDDRDRYVAEKQKEMATGEDTTFDSAVIGSLRSAAKKKGFEFE